ncbi:hypothetical protein CAPTEDRAFT_203237 [Capitella teleta]|uniref:Alpha 1,4-glycosyltransferase domain-containing protein n=1 Tax=Capitella teleta TaxID=283909 RepID=R7TZQ6_CAPTE|nr:hypothetical protein CAPTEDRAFT_203237 [Capitella teleta]|eukprot:ELT96871.1 hypothetical protein CAPTEDRAFT_203237 [Capitella teleta]
MHDQRCAYVYIHCEGCNIPEEYLCMEYNYGLVFETQKSPKLIGISLVVIILLSYIVCSALHLSTESWLVVFLNTFATTKPTDCSKGTDFTKRPSFNNNHLTLDLGSDGYLVPNIVHYIWYVDNRHDLSFINMLAIISADRFLNPTAIYFYCNHKPKGPNWDRVMRKVPSLAVVHQRPVTCVYGTPITNPVFGPSSSDLERVTTLMDKGGIYLDLDVIVVRSFDPLRNHSCTVGLETRDKVNSGVLVCHRNSPFLRLWLEHYIADYKVWMWNYNAGWVPAYLAERYPEYIHLEPNRLQRPNGDEIDMIWGPESFNWRDNYAVHLLVRTWRSKNLFMVEEPNMDYISRTNSTFSQLARRIILNQP